MAQTMGRYSTKVLLQPLANCIRGVCGITMPYLEILWKQPLIVSLCKGLFYCQLCIPNQWHHSFTSLILQPPSGVRPDMYEVIIQIYILQSQPHTLCQSAASLTKKWHEEFDSAA